MADLLFELGTEELPPKSLKNLRNSLLDNVKSGLDKASLTFEDIHAYASPRRLAIVISALAERQPDQINQRRGPAVAAAFDADGNPTKAAQGFASSCGVKVEELERVDTDKWLFDVKKD